MTQYHYSLFSLIEVFLNIFANSIGWTNWYLSVKDYIHNSENLKLVHVMKHLWLVFCTVCRALLRGLCDGIGPTIWEVARFVHSGMCHPEAWVSSFHNHEQLSFWRMKFSCWFLLVIWRQCPVDPSTVRSISFLNCISRCLVWEDIFSHSVFICTACRL